MEGEDGAADSTGTTTSSISDLPINTNDLLHLLSDEATRHLLYLLIERGGTIRLEAINDYFESNHSEIRFHHTILPKLVDYHIIDYNSDSGAITPTPLCDDLQPALETIKSLESNDVDEFLAETSR